MNCTEDYVSFETAKLLKEKGFYEDVNTSYVIDATNRPAIRVGDFLYISCSGKTHLIEAPTLQMAMKWIRKVGNLFIEIDFDTYETEDGDSVTTKTGYSFALQKKEKPDEYEYIHNWVYDTYEEAVEAAINYCLTNLI